MIFDKVVDATYKLTVEETLEIKQLLEHNIIEAKKEDIYKNYKISSKQERNGTLTFSSDIKSLNCFL